MSPGQIEKNSERSQAPFWTRSVEETAESLAADISDGLSDAEAGRRLREKGRNVLRTRSRRSLLSLLVSQFTNVIMLLLAAAAAASFLFGHFVDGAGIFVAILVNAGIGFFTERRAVREMESLKKLEPQSATVVRGGAVESIRPEALIPGDVLLLDSGDIVTADLRLFETNNLQINESALTGESVPVLKRPDAAEADAPIAERTCMAYRGTSITQGTGKGLVTATGMDTEIGRVSRLVQEVEEEQESDPLRRQVEALSRRLIWVILAVAAVSAAGGIIVGRDLFLMIEIAVVLAVAAVPEGLPIVESVALARGMRKMANRNALVRRLPAVQTLGSTTVIFTDKTGTLTENRMSLRELHLPGGDIRLDPGGTVTPEDHPLAFAALRVGALCTNASVRSGPEDAAAVGDPMEVALLKAALAAGIDPEQLREQMPERREVAFSPQSMMMATYHAGAKEGILVAVKGAPERVLERCDSRMERDGSRTPFESPERQEWLARAEELAGRGMRLLALAEKRVDNEEEEPYSGLTLLGLAALEDPPRTEIERSIAECRRAGVRVVMVTGDKAATAAHVARAVGLGNSEAIEGSRLGSPAELSEERRNRILSTSVFARVSPEQKLDVIGVYRDAGEIVAMTGDGVNDSPALKKADIGIAMGKRGEAVAREAADIVLLDDEFRTITAAIRIGRAIFNNIRKFVVYLLSGNIGEILIVGIASILDSPLPLLPLQILYLNAINDVFPALALGLNEEGEEVMTRPPRDPSEPLVTRGNWFASALYGLLIAAAVLSAFYLSLGPLGLSQREAVTVSFLSLALARLWHVFNMRDSDSGFWNNQVRKNRWVWRALLLCVVLVVGATYLRGLADVLSLTRPGAAAWVAIVCASLLPLIVGQVGIATFRRLRQPPPRRHDAFK